MSKSKPSKTARKREYLALQELGEQLIGLTREQLNSIGLDERLLDAVIVAQNMRAHGALRRQKQLIGKLMRDTDAEPIRKALDTFGRNDRADKKIFMLAEEWRNRIVTGDFAALESFQELIGHENDALTDQVRAMLSAPHEKARRLARREIFREIHRELTLMMQRNPRSI